MIGRLNVGGPAIQALTLTRSLRARSYETVLVRGVEGPQEGTMDHLAVDLGVVPVRFASLRRELGIHDLLALAHTIWLLARTRPAILHTHAAKAGAVGRAAALLLGPAAPRVRVHTFHGHVLTDYFGRRRSSLFVTIERLLARRTTRLVAVSDEVREDLLALRIAPADRIVVIPLGLDLERFHLSEPEQQRRRGALRATLGIGPEEIVVCLVARLVAIKRVDRFLRIARRVNQWRPDVRFMIVGDGDLGATLRRSADAVALGDRLLWTGMRLDIPDIYLASDVVALTSDNEGTPVSLIEAQAAARPTVATAVGGVPTVVRHGLTGLTVARDDEAGFARAIADLVADADRREGMGQNGRDEVMRRFGLDRLVHDIDALYRTLLAGAGNAAGAGKPR